MLCFCFLLDGYFKFHMNSTPPKKNTAEIRYYKTYFLIILYIGTTNLLLALIPNGQKPEENDSHLRIPLI